MRMTKPTFAVVAGLSLCLLAPNVSYANEVNATAADSGAAVESVQTSGKAGAAASSGAAGSAAQTSGAANASSASAAGATSAANSEGSGSSSGATATPAAAGSTGEAATSKKDSALQEGVYELQYAVSTDKRLEVSAGSGSNGAKVQTWSDNTTGAQRWRLRSSGDYYTLQNVNSGKFLDVPGASAYQGASLQQYSGNGTKSQQWRIVADPKRSGYYTLHSRLNDRLVLDINGASRGNGARAQLYTANGTAAQSFRFNLLTPLVSDGVYSLTNVGSGKVLDVSGASLASGGNIQQYQSNDSQAQRYYLHYKNSTGYYTVTNVQSGKALDVYGAGSYNGANVQQYTSNNTKAQLWTIRSAGNGSYTLATAIDGRVLDVSGGSKSNSANVQTYQSNGTGAQKWIFTRRDSWLSDGTYQLISALNTNNAIALSTGSGNGAAVRTYARNAKDPFNKWQLVSSGNGYWRLIDLGTGRAMTASAGARNGSALTASDYTGSASQLFKVVMTSTGIKLASMLDNSYVVDINGASTARGAKAQLYRDNGTNAQRYSLVGASLYETDVPYSIRSASNLGLSMDVPSASIADGTHLQMYSNNGTAAQTFMLKSVGDGSVYIVNANSMKYINQIGTWPTQSAQGYAAARWRVSFDSSINALRITSTQTGQSITLGGSSSGSALTMGDTASGNRSQGFVFKVASAAVNTASKLNGVDVSHWQQDIILANVATDFVIAKATEGVSYIDSCFTRFADQTLALGRGLGLYHFMRDSSYASAEAQADYFVNAVKKYLGKAVLFLDWEDTKYSKVEKLGPSFAKRFLDRVYAKTGVKPLIYTNHTVSNYYDWSSVSNAGYKLWGAQYLYRYEYNGATGFESDPSLGNRSFGSWGKPLIYQYKSTGKLNGYSGNLDLDIFYGTRASWDALAR